MECQVSAPCPDPDLGHTLALPLARRQKFGGGVKLVSLLFVVEFHCCCIELCGIQRAAAINAAAVIICITCMHAQAAGSAMKKLIKMQLKEQRAPHAGQTSASTCNLFLLMVYFMKWRRLKC